MVHVFDKEMTKIEQILENTSDPLFIADNKLNIQYSNAAAKLLSSGSDQKSWSQNIADIFREVIGIEFHDYYSWTTEERVPVQFDTYIDDHDKWYHIKLSPLEDGGFVLCFHDITRQKAAEQKLKDLSYYDSLTGLPNRRRIEETVQQLLKKEINFTLLYISLDHLKYINQLHNHTAGDELLKQVAGRMEKLLSATDEVGRLEGNRFVLIHPHKEEEDNHKFTEMICGLFDQPFLLKGFQSVSISASIGSVSCPLKGANFEELLAYGEAAMREAKKKPGTSCALFHCHMSIDLARRLQIEKDLSGNLAELGFHFHIQPQIDRDNGKLVAVEVLSRWNHPELGLIPPLEFIEIAEETGAITHLTRHLLHEVFSYIKEREARYGCGLRTAINLTPSLLSNSSFFDSFSQLLSDYAIPPELIEIEITESTELTYSEKTLQNLLAYQSKGISIAIDDFGTGFSMLAYLTQFPINKIKLDKFFTQNIGRDPKSEGVLQSLIQFVLSIGCELMAEGVETEEEAEFLKAHGCSAHQGYLYDRPMGTEEFEGKYLVDEKGKIEIKKGTANGDFQKNV